VFDAANVSVSPDGRWIAFVARANPQDTFTLYVRPVAGVTPQRLAGTDAATQPFWSADSQSIAFVSGGKLRKVDIKGGATEDVCDVANFVGGSWNSEGTIIFGTPQGLFRVSAQGGKPEALTTLAKSEAGHFWPRFLPDGRHYLYLAWSSAEDGRAIYAGTLGSNERMKVINTESKSVYSDPGYLLFRSDNAVYARRFDPGSLAVSGDAIRVADEVTSSSSANGQGDFDVSTNGTLIYYQSAGGPGLIGPQSDGASWQLQWISRNGQDLERAGPYGTYRGFELSPNGRRIAVHRHEPTGGDVIVLEPRGASLNITVDASRHNSMPIWSPDGSRIVYNSLRDGKWGLYEARSNGTGYERLLFESELLKVPMSWPDDRHLVFWVQDPKSAGDVWLLTLGDKKAEASPLIATAQYNESHPQVSPDKKWIAYTSNRTGRNEIYVQPFPTGSGFYKVSINGGDWARWNPAANELFFRELGDGAFVGDILSAPFTVTDGAFENSDPKPLVETGAMNLAHSSGDYHMYAVAPDGQSFLVLQFVNRLVNLASVGAIGPDPDFGLIVALNWTSALENGTR
jgi:Tol biopolymer transport system component